MAWGRNKFRAKRTEVDGIMFASKSEAKRYEQLKELLDAGEIWDLELQPVFTFEINGELLRYPSKRVIKYLADFRYQTKDGEVIEDVKGMDTPMSKLKRSLVAHIHKQEVIIIK